MKRLFDILVAGATCGMLAIPMLVIAGIVRVSDGGPAIFRQVRVGRGGRPFEILKFRTMIVNAEKAGGYRTADRDPRITAIGAFLRRTSLDELPQLLNVLKGDMSIVGPRPDVPSQESEYAPEDWQLRHTVRPGITGLAQALKRSTATPEERTAIDLRYVRSASFLLDLRIILMTARQLLARTGN
ncbi:sugar transferase [Sphingomonas gei]|uniref:Sugar transferase n=1 Tax=Sphingomonas gei TaxID=1395960 RepID=A0A4S1X349_9SPHN|nr:sugar transferase [Sphingomonas gei]TGX50369.1 sugar transferase [Sphingomonas gei]